MNENSGFDASTEQRNPDREKVIKSVEYAFDFWISDFDGCSDFDTEKAEQEKRDAIALLKEQEAVEPTLIREGRNKYYNDYVCPRCDNEVVYEQNYCSECGVKFMWEGR